MKHDFENPEILELAKQFADPEQLLSAVDRLVSAQKNENKRLQDDYARLNVDVSELVQFKGQVSSNDKLATLGEMFAGIIHDINNPLSMIEGNIWRIRKMVIDEEVLTLLETIEMSSKKISKIVQGIKAYVRQDNTQPFEVEQLGRILDDAVTICENKLKEHGVTLRIDPQLAGVKLKCHFTQMFQVFMNLIINSIDAVNALPEKWIELKLLDDGGDAEHIKIQLMDSGAGIPEELQSKIFTAFFTTKGRGLGSGLGLSLCSKIIQAHGGSLSIDNSQQHTTFVIELKKS